MAGRRPDRANVLELAVLGLLADAPLHGYELRKRLNTTLGALRAFSYGSLYPCLKDLLRRELIAEDARVPAADPGRGAAARPLAGRRAKIVYRLTSEGREQLRRRLAEAGPAAWEDDGFGVHFTLFAQTRADIRLRILEGRRNRLEERVESCRTALARSRERQDGYAAELQRHGLESVEREVRWLNELIGRERAAAGERGAQQRRHAPSSGTDRGDAD